MNTALVQLPGTYHTVPRKAGGKHALIFILTFRVSSVITNPREPDTSKW